ncbi:MAG: protoporphyrinogen oxidase, partial [Legionella sp.]
RRLEQIAKEQGQSIKIVILERESVVGGKCHTYKDPQHPELRTEEGAGAVAPNYGVVIDALNECGISYEKMISVDETTVEIKKIYDSLSGLEKFKFVKQLTAELCTFNKDYDRYQKAVAERTDLPVNLQLPFAEYCRTNAMKYLPTIVKPFVPGFGYGAITECPTYSVLAYLGKTTIPEILFVDNFTKQPSLLAIHGGFQGLMEAIAQSFDVRLRAQITRIQRTSRKVSVSYMQDGIECVETGDTLVLATPPKSWPSLGLDMTEVERRCVANLDFYRYPVAVYKIKGLPQHQYYFPKGLEAEGFGHLALITTRDNRPNPPDGRLCTVYVNLPPGDNNFKFDHAKLIDELKTIAGVTDVEVIEEKIWEDYLPSLDWQTRLDLAKEEEDGSTYHLGAYALGGFEDVACVAEVATKTMDTAFSAHLADNGFIRNLKRVYHFFHDAVYPPVSAVAAVSAVADDENLIEFEV